MVEPNRVTDDIGRKSVTLVGNHHPIISQRRLSCQYRHKGIFSSIVFIHDGFDRILTVGDVIEHPCLASAKEQDCEQCY
jgi:hypothetical protein